MARKSGGTIPGPQQIADGNQALAILDAMHHWGVTRTNGNGRRGYSLTITHAGKRVTAHRLTFVDAAVTALAKLRGQAGTFMKIAD